MIAGIGIDIVEHGRVERIHERYGEKFARRILDDTEMEDYQGASSKARLLAKRFAAKEAAVKALGTGFSMGITLNMVAIRHDDSGRPLLELNSVAKKVAESKGVDVLLISISDETEYAVAMVVFEAYTSGLA